MPLSTNSSTKPTTNSGSDSSWLAVEHDGRADRHGDEVPAGDPRAAEAVGQRPPTGRISEPSSGPSKVSDAAASGVANESANWFCSTWPKANPKPMNEPNVPM